MENDLPKIQIKQYVKMSFASLGIWIAIGIVFAFLVGGYNAFYGNNLGLSISREVIFGIGTIFGLTGVLGLIILPFSIWRLSMISYEFGKNILTIRGGIIARYEKNLLFSKIQHTVVTQSLLQRIFGLSDLAIQTAGQEIIAYSKNGQPIITSPTIPSLLKEDAEKVREEIISRVSKFNGQGL
jgi:uncharacterized membrane protein YdbT with pleckstrin-like domain